LRSSAFDLLFFREMREHTGKGLTPLQQVNQVANSLNRMVPGLAKELGFQIYRRKKGPTFSVVPLIGERQEA
jgi:hypothetical protein